MERINEPFGRKASCEDIPRTSAACSNEFITDAESKLIIDLKKCYLETIALDVQFQKEIYIMEKRYQEAHNAIYAKRKELIDMGKRDSPDIPNNSPFKAYWMVVLKGPFRDYITQRDEMILMHLNNLRSEFTNDPIVKFDLVFEFTPNDYFDNAVLTKTYYLNCEPDPNDPLSFDGAEIFKCEGSKINWKDPSYDPSALDPNAMFKPVASFFNFFSPPAMPEDSDQGPDAIRARCILQNDYELGFYIKERIIPKSILFFTGEISDCQMESTSEGEDEDDSDENDVDLDEISPQQLANEFQNMLINPNSDENKDDVADPAKNVENATKSAGGKE